MGIGHRWLPIAEKRMGLRSMSVCLWIRAGFAEGRFAR